MSARFVRVLAALVLACGIGSGAGCAIVPKNRRQYLADPTMQPTDDPLREKAADKMHTAREGAAGGNGEPAGGGCGCTN
jgi:hypothetical protein